MDFQVATCRMHYHIPPLLITRMCNILDISVFSDRNVTTQ
uniref:Uncharacterized protein n=1 Tax=Arundo donax TaxID=35708 RepID=A0A0A8YD88_ARUDO